MAGDPFNLDRFVAAQAGGVYEQALAELGRAASAATGCGSSSPAPRSRPQRDRQIYGLSGIDEARAYAAHPLLGSGCANAAERSCRISRPEREAILGPIDALKLRSSMAIFAEAVPDEPLFADLLAANGLANLDSDQRPPKTACDRLIAKADAIDVPPVAAQIDRPRASPGAEHRTRPGILHSAIFEANVEIAQANGALIVHSLTARWRVWPGALIISVSRPLTVL
jgi:uncharacterized protein (DUF1810 family)